jgi:uncharacterized Zn finger protein (UPF0148 family)
MKCRKCNSEIPDGELICPRCGAEINLVPDYRPVEFMIDEKKREDREKQEQRRRAVQKKRKRRRRKKRVSRKKESRRSLIMTFLILLLIIAAAFGIIRYIRYRNTRSFEYQYERSQEEFLAGNTSSARSYAEKALELSPKSVKCLRLMAQIEKSEGDIEAASKTLETVIEIDPGNIDVYGQLISLYTETNDYDSIHELMENCKSEEVLLEYADYVCTAPAITPIAGTYSKEVSVTIGSPEKLIYYTTDGTDPTTASELYTDKIKTRVGRNEIRAIAVNEIGIKSNVTVCVYNIEITRPDPPVISEPTGVYEEGSQIHVTAPEGCIIYYAFDDVPSTGSAEYTGPVTMPVGSHVFSCIAVDSDGNPSENVNAMYIIVG